MAVVLHHSNCLAALAEMEAGSVDTIITDPPYGLKFMGKAWDHGVPGVPFWEAALRVAKPGAMLLAFGGTRTHHRLMCAIEDAGWEIRDCLMWLYGSGLTKGLNISKAMDKTAGAEREVLGPSIHHSPGRTKEWGDGNTYGTQDHQGKWITAPATPAAELWDGWGTTLKPAWEPIILAMKPLDGTFVHNALEHGVAGLWVDGSRVPMASEDKKSEGGETAHPNQTGSMFSGIGGSPQDQTLGRWPANLVLSHSPDCKRIGTRKVKGAPQGTRGEWNAQDSLFDMKEHAPYPGHADPDGLETVAAWECVEDCPIRLLDEQAGTRPSGARPNLQGKLYRSPRDVYGEMKGCAWDSPHNDAGSASRYFLNLEGAIRFFYQPKAPNREKWFFCPECDDAYRMRGREEHRHGHPNWKHLFIHPTQKPLGLIRYLCRLTRTPTGGTVLDMFMGTGTTGEAAILEGRNFVGCELERPSFVIASRKIEAVQSEIVQSSF